MKKAESSLEYLQKLFILPDTTDKFMEFGLAVLEMIYDFFKEKKGLHKKITLRTCDISEVSRLPTPSRSRDGVGRPITWPLTGSGPLIQTMWGIAQKKDIHTLDFDVAS